jgi:Gpi18-like mannosyltransferase
MRFVVAAWLASRVIIVAAFVLASPHPLASGGNWDGGWYGAIASHGYGFAHRGAQSDSAFFPLYPLIASLIMRMGVGWPLAGIAVNNVAFLAAMLVLYRLAAERWNSATARWCVAVACACPLSLFGSVAYRDGLYLLLSALALWSALRSQRLRAALAAGAASATAVGGVALAAAFVVESLVQRRGLRAAAVAALSFSGIIAYVLFCWYRFGDPLAPLHAQHGWRTAGFEWRAWVYVLQDLTSFDGLLQNAMVVVLVPLGAIAVIVQHKALGLLMTLYTLFTLAILAVAGGPMSADRYAYDVIPILIAYGRALQRVPALGIAALTVSLVLLGYDAVQFARFHWVA